MSRDYREKEVEGVIGDIRAMLSPKQCKVTVRMTSDKNGKSLSLQAYNILIEIPLESVADIITLAERR